MLARRRFERNYRDHVPLVKIRIGFLYHLTSKANRLPARAALHPAWIETGDERIDGRTCEERSNPPPRKDVADDDAHARDAVPPQPAEDFVAQPRHGETVEPGCARVKDRPHGGTPVDDVAWSRA